MQVAVPGPLVLEPTSPRHSREPVNAYGPGITAERTRPSCAAATRGHCPNAETDPSEAPAPSKHATGEPSAGARTPVEGTPNSETYNDPAGIFRGLQVIREGIIPLVSSQSMRLRENRHVAAGIVHRAKDRAKEEVDRLRFVERKVAENRAINDRALEEYEKAQEVLRAAHDDRPTPMNLEEKMNKRKYVQNCEALVKSWGVNLDVARLRLAGWEFKHTRQIAIVGQLTIEAHNADLNYTRISHNIDMDIANLQAQSELLGGAAT